MTTDHDLTVQGYHYDTGKPVSVRMRDGRIVAVQPVTSIETPVWIGPGLVDMQVNGYLGGDFNTQPLREQTVIEVTKALWAQGVTSYLPTIITNSDKVIEQAVRKIAEVIRKNPTIRHSMPGIHLEGPFISAIDGPRGAHDKRFVKAPNWLLFQRWQEAADGLIRLITLSPEWEEAPVFIRQCVSSGVKVAIGHTSASTQQILDAVDSGATLSTHLGNGAHPVIPRHPNYIWDQLADESLWASIIADGFHLPESVIKVMLKVKQNKLMLISDAVFLSGMKPGMYKTHIGGDIQLTPEGKLHLAERPELLAGSVQSVIRGIDHLVRHHLVPFGQAWDMASIRPSQYLGLASAAGLDVGAPADLVVFHKKENGTLVQQVYQGGVLVYQDSQYN